MWRLWLVGTVAVLSIGLMNVGRVDRTNKPVNLPESIEAQTQMPQNVAAILHRACQDCHSELTHWPWYSNVAPFLWLFSADVYGAREHMNLSTWGRYTPQERTGRLIAMCEMVASNKMPLWYYKLAHYPSAWLSDGDKKAVCDWAKAEVQRSTLTQNLSSEKEIRR